jgi:hypothetical protein
MPYFANTRVRRDDREPLLERPGDEQPVERVAVVEGKAYGPSRVPAWICT